MHRRTAFGLGLTLLGVGAGASVAFESGYFAAAMGVAGAALVGLGVGVLAGGIDPDLPDEDAAAVPNRALVGLVALGVVALAALAALLVG